ncbi:unnamed protein product [Dibothriocephalus latus]|uniref:Ig-like domain-containing protein n=1 Tax=Dibothriocephalus latus TaxID=60516 RepID=A0A3P6T0E6_DIBLA|nr:unnamed protein product [Dibothriocephalus latus]
MSILQNEEERGSSLKISVQFCAPAGFPRFLNVFSVIVAKKNEKVELECQTQGDPPPTVRWYKDSIPVDLTSPRFVKNGKPTRGAGAAAGCCCYLLPLPVQPGTNSIRLPIIQAFCPASPAS